MGNDLKTAGIVGRGSEKNGTEIDLTPWSHHNDNSPPWVQNLSATVTSDITGMVTKPLWDWVWTIDGLVAAVWRQEFSSSHMASIRDISKNNLGFQDSHARPGWPTTFRLQFPRRRHDFDSPFQVLGGHSFSVANAAGGSPRYNMFSPHPYRYGAR